jgi:hypothetical protein
MSDFCISQFQWHLVLVLQKCGKEKRKNSSKVDKYNLQILSATKQRKENVFFSELFIVVTMFLLLQCFVVTLAVIVVVFIVFIVVVVVAI